MIVSVPFGGTLGAAGDRRVHEADAGRREPLGELARGPGRDGRAVDDQRARGQPGGQTTVAEEHGLHVRRVGDADDHDLAGGWRLPRG